MKHILITGSSGYVGSSFIKLYSKYFKISTFSLLSDTLDDLDLFEIDTILHCAALVHKNKKYLYEEYFNINAQYTRDLALKAKESGVRHFVFLSTIAVYHPEEQLLNLNVKPDPITFYGKSKLQGEILVENLASVDFKVCIVRPPMIYGFEAPGNFTKLQKLVEKVPLLPFSNIQNKRTFIYIENLCFSLKKIIENSTVGTFLISDDQSISTSDLIKSLVVNSKKNRFVFKVPFLSEILKSAAPSMYRKLFTNLVVDNSDSKSINGYENPYTLKEGLQRISKSK